MVFDGLKALLTDLNFNASSICTSWDEIKSSEHFCDYSNYDYFPVTNNGILTSIVCRTQNNSKEEIKLTQNFYLKKEANILDVVNAFKTNYCKPIGNVKPKFLILGSKEQPTGMLTFADLNREEVSVLIWRTIKNVEILLKKAIGEVTNDEIELSLGSKTANRIKESFEDDNKNGLDLNLINYLSLDQIKEVLKKCKSDSVVWDNTKGRLTHGIVEFRNRVSHHRTKKSLISKDQEIKKLHESLQNLECLYVKLNELIGKESVD